MIKRDFHVHTTYCDGKASAEEMIISAINKGMDMIGFSGHAYTSRDETWCMSREKTVKYIRELKTLREKYAGVIKILIGAEQDYYSDGEDCSVNGINLPDCDERFYYDYRIGSVHYVEIEGSLYEIDDSAEDHRNIADRYFDGDLMALAELYYQTEADVLRKTGADIIGHFNLIEKFNEKQDMYDTDSERYRSAWQKAADSLLVYGKPFEINTGAISRGYRTEAYPSREMMEYIAGHGGSFILSSDSHAASTLLFGFDELEKYVRSRDWTLLDRPAL